MMKEVVIDKKKAVALAERMSVPCHSNGIEFVTLDRLENISKELKETKYNYINEDGIFKLYAQKKIEDINGELLVISSHIDCLQTNAIFEKEQKEHPKRMKGIFDNAITNAACLYLMKYCDIPENVVFAFTGDEEDNDDTEYLMSSIGEQYKKTETYLNNLRKKDGLSDDDELDMLGAYSVCKYLKSKRKDFKAIVLDCTYCAFKDKVEFTLENDFIYQKDEKWINEIIECLVQTQLKWKFIPANQEQKLENPDDYVKVKKIIKNISKHVLSFDETYGDETYEYDARDISCISFCLPCDADDMHSNNGFGIRRKNYYNYIKVLYMLCSIDL